MLTFTAYYMFAYHNFYLQDQKLCHSRSLMSEHENLQFYYKFLIEVLIFLLVVIAGLAILVSNKESIVELIGY